MIGKGGGANGMRAGDRVRSTLDGRVGTAVEFLQDGDAVVQWDDTGTLGGYKWNHLERIGDGAALFSTSHPSDDLAPEKISEPLQIDYPKGWQLVLTFKSKEDAALFKRAYEDIDPEAIVEAEISLPLNVVVRGCGQTLEKMADELLDIAPAALRDKLRHIARTLYGTADELEDDPT